MNHEKYISRQQLRRRRHVRGVVRGTPARPRLSVFRSLQHIYCQVIDDLSGKTLASASTREQGIEVKFGGNVEAAEIVGKSIAERAKAVGVTAVCFDRGHCKFHGRVAALAAAAREGGLQF